MIQTAAISTASKPRPGWVIQIGAFPDESEARERLQSAQNIAKGILGKADPFTERVIKGRETLYRARFVGLDEHRAEAACKYFKRNKIDCFAVQELTATITVRSSRRQEDVGRRDASRW